MKVTGIIAEYNPFHNGHKYHLESSKKITNSDYCIVVMSGNYVQRGEPAIADKWIRTKMALQNGADIVIELPSIYATSSAEFFAQNSINILNSTNIVDSICFGSEINDIKLITKFATILSDEPLPYKSILKRELSKGVSFPTARSTALKEYTGYDSKFLESPNNILGVEYLKSLIKLNSKLVPYTLKRNVAYNSKDLNDNITSALSIRESLKSNNIEIIKSTIPMLGFNTLLDSIKSGNSPIFLDNFSTILNYKLRTNDKLDEILDIDEGVENRILNAASSNFKVTDIIKAVKTKRYTFTKLQRALLHIILDIKKSDLKKYNLNLKYIRILGFRKQSEKLLSYLISNSDVPVITNLKKALNTMSKDTCDLIYKENLFTDIYFLANPSLNKRLPNKEYTMPIIVY